MNKNMFMSKIKLFGDTVTTLANTIGISSTRLSAKINGWRNAEFTQSEIMKIKTRYDLAAYEIEQIFFNEEMSVLDTVENNERSE
jgi:hypothetical protein